MKEIPTWHPSLAKEGQEKFPKNTNKKKVNKTCHFENITYTIKYVMSSQYITISQIVIVVLFRHEAVNRGSLTICSNINIFRLL